MLTGMPLWATNPTMPWPHWILISSFFSISSSVDLEQTSKSLDTRQRLEGGAQLLPCTRNNELRSARSSVLTFCKILWHKLRTSSSLQMSLTSSKIISFSSSSRSSLRERRCPEPPPPPGPMLLLPPDASSWCDAQLVLSWLGVTRNVGVPSIVVTIGFVRPPRSNSCAEILRTGVVAPEPPREEPPGCVGESPLDEADVVADDDVACVISHASTTCRVAFLQQHAIAISLSWCVLIK